MAGNNIKLTISLLASNRKDTLPRCLESLRPLLENVESELIIVDTGCDEELLMFIKKYTSNIIKFTWCNDFAAARNVGLDKAQGQWFMFIDDDEWFEDVSELIAFFNSKESEEYVSANYVVRNYKTLKGNEYSEGVVGRIFRMYDGIKFVGKVHECVAKTEGKTKQLTSYVHHYGYVYENEEKRDEHFERNTQLLIDEIKNNPIDARNYAHIYQEYRLMDKPDIALDYAGKALDEADEKFKGNKISLCSTYVCFLWAYTRKKEYEKVIKWGEEFLSSKPVTGLTEAAMSAYMANGYIKMEIYDKAMECADKYVRIRDAYKYDKTRYYKELGPMLNDTFEQVQVGRAISAGFKAALYNDDLEKSLTYILAYDWSKNIYMVEPESIDDMVSLIGRLRISEKDSVFKDCVRVFGKMFTNAETSKILLGNITKIRDEDLDGYTCLYKIMSQVAGQEGYRELVDIIAAYKVGDMDKMMDIYISVLSKGTYMFTMEDEFYQIAMDRRIPIGSMIQCIDASDWRERVNAWIKKARNMEIVLCKKRMDMFIEKESIHMKIFDEEIVGELENRKK